MRKIVSLSAMEDFQLKLKFDDGSEKKFDVKPYFQFPVFSILKDPSVFKQVINRSYYIEWQGQQIDLSADTLWHEGKNNS
ncbi:MAG: DUF2442 domain-containing protein [Cyclobacteriaceae bacterium]|nr:DUF2442 domain-containing protein [Cyclobacteriaceae bacterium]